MSDPVRPRVLVVAQPYPFPTNDGFTVRVADQCRALAERCDLHLLTTRETRTELPPDPCFVSVTRWLPGERGWLERVLARTAGRVARRIVPPHFDDPYYAPDDLLARARALHERHDFHACIVHTPAWARVFDAFPRDVIRIVDAHDIWHRKYREFRALGKGKLLAQFRDAERELAAYRAADATIAISTADHDHLVASGIGNSIHCPVSFSPRHLGDLPEEPTLLYAASSGETNLDAIRVTLGTILPAVRARVPGTRLLLMGGGVAVRSEFGGAEGVEVLPFLPDVDDAYRRARVVIVPLRHGTGLKIKVLESLARGIPTIISPVAAEGMRLEDYAQETFPEPGPQFAGEVVRALTDRGYRAALAASAHRVIETHYGAETVHGPLLDLLLSRTPGAQRDLEATPAGS